MATNSPIECGVCQEVFNEDLRCPRTLPCSHHLCSDCINQLIIKNSKICPFCRKNFTANSAKDVMINHGLLECAQHMILQKTKFVKSSKKKSTLYQQRIVEFKEVASKANRDVLNNLQALKKQAEQLIKDLKELKSSFTEERTDLQENILPQIHGILKKIDKNSENLEPAVRKLEDQLKDIDEKEGLLTYVKMKLDSADSFEDVAAFLDEAETTTIAVSEWSENLEECLAEEDGQLQIAIKEVKVSKRVRKDLMEALASKAEDEVTSPLPIMGAAAVQMDFSVQVTAIALWEMRSPVKRLVEQERLFAVQQRGSKRRSAKITIENNKLHLYSLMDEPKPDPNVYYLQYEDVLALVGSTRSMFLDIGSQGSTVGRVHILLNSEAPADLPLHCSGGKGSCYVEKIFQVLDKGSLLGQVLCGGPPKKAEMRNNLNYYSLRQQYPGHTWSGQCGSVNLLERESIPPLFAIRTGPYKMSYNPNCGGRHEVNIGDVTEGLHVIRDTISCWDDTDFSISSCGMVLSTEFPIN